MASQINVIYKPDPMTPMNPFSTTQKLPADVSRIVYIGTHEDVRKSNYVNRECFSIEEIERKYSCILDAYECGHDVPFHSA